MTCPRRVALITAFAALSVADDSALADAGYSMRVPAEVTIAPEEPGAVSLMLVPDAGHSISRDGPITIDLRVMPASGLVLPKSRYQRGDAADALADRPRFDLGVRGPAPGVFRLHITARFWVCAQRSCLPAREERTVTVRVHRAEDAAPAG